MNNIKTDHSTFIKLDNIVQERVDAIRSGNEKIDIELFKSIIKIHSWFRGANSIISNSDNIVSIEDIIITNDYHGMELFMTSIDMKCLVRIKGRRKRIGMTIGFFWYILATSKNLTEDTIQRLYQEISTSGFMHHHRLFLWDENKYLWGRKFIDVLLLNKNVDKNIELFLRLQ
jgi:hypothetical protein